MSFFGSKAKTKSAPAVPQKDDAMAVAKEEARKRRGRVTQTILTGPRGAETNAGFKGKTLLGQ